MARCKLTRMNLRNIRKTKEYQVLLIDLVATGVIRQDAAEGILGYTIPAGLLGSTTPADDDDDEGSGTEGSGGESDTGNTVTLLYFKPKTNEWGTAAYDLTEDPTGDNILTFAQDAFSDEELNAITIVEEAKAPYYVEGTSELSGKYVPLDPQPETLESGMLIKVFTAPTQEGEGN